MLFPCAVLVVQSICLSYTRPSVLSTYTFILSIYLSIYLSICLSILKILRLKNLNGLKSKKIPIIHTSVRSTFLLYLCMYVCMYVSIYLLLCVAFRKKRLRSKKCKKSKLISVYHPSVHPCGLYHLSCIGHPCDLSIYLSIYLSIVKNNELNNLNALKSKRLSTQTHPSVRPSIYLSIYPKNIALKKKDIYHTHVRLFDLPDLSIYLSIYLSILKKKCA